MKPNEIRAEMIKNNVTGAKIAAALKVSRPTVSQVISGKAVSARIWEEIARSINLPVEQVFPVTKEAA